MNMLLDAIVVAMAVLTHQPMGSTSTVGPAMLQQQPMGSESTMGVGAAMHQTPMGSAATMGVGAAMTQQPMGSAATMGVGAATHTHQGRTPPIKRARPDNAPTSSAGTRRIKWSPVAIIASDPGVATVSIITTAATAISTSPMVTAAHTSSTVATPVTTAALSTSAITTAACCSPGLTPKQIHIQWVGHAAVEGIASATVLPEERRIEAILIALSSDAALGQLLKSNRGPPMPSDMATAAAQVRLCEVLFSRRTSPPEVRLAGGLCAVELRLRIELADVGRQSSLLALIYTANGWNIISAFSFYKKYLPDDDRHLFKQLGSTMPKLPFMKNGVRPTMGGMWP